MAGTNSIDAVKRKIKVLQQQADEAEERAEILQRQVEEEKRAREQVKIFEPFCVTMLPNNRKRLHRTLGSFRNPSKELIFQLTPLQIDALWSNERHFEAASCFVT